MTRTVLLLVGQIAAGKTSVGRRIASSTGAALSSADQRRKAGEATSPTAIAEDLVSYPRAIYECSGGGADFELLVAEIRRRGSRPFVAMLRLGVQAAQARVRARGDTSAPLAAADWPQAIADLDRRLEYVPADLVVDAERTAIDEAADVVARAWREESSRPDPGAPPGSYSFSGLATHAVCPLRYRYKVIDRMPEPVVSASLVAGQLVHHVLRELYRPGAAKPDEDAAAAVLQAAVRVHGPPVDSERIERAIRFHARTFVVNDRRETLDTELPVAVGLGDGVELTGVVDRLVRGPTGVLEVIEYKSGVGSSNGAPWFPSMLQVAGYGAAVMVEHDQGEVFVERHVVATGDQERRLLDLSAVATIRLALRRWIARVGADTTLSATPGRHCTQCPYAPVCPDANPSGRVPGRG